MNPQQIYQQQYAAYQQQQALLYNQQNAAATTANNSSNTGANLYFNPNPQTQSAIQLEKQRQWL